LPARVQQAGSVGLALAKTTGQISEKLKTANSRIAHECRTNVPIVCICRCLRNRCWCITEPGGPPQASKLEPCGCCSSKMSARRRFIAKGLREQSHAVDLARDVDQIPGVGAGRLRTGFFHRKVDCGRSPGSNQSGKPRRRRHCLLRAAADADVHCDAPVFYGANAIDTCHL
jgi:hypothetical protein